MAIHSRYILYVPALCQHLWQPKRWRANLPSLSIINSTYPKRNMIITIIIKSIKTDRAFKKT